MREYLNLTLPEGARQVSVKLDDEGVVLDVLDRNGDVIESTWKLYDEFGKRVESLSEEAPASQS